MNAEIALLTRSRDAPTMPASSSCVTGQHEAIAVAGQFEQPLGGAAGDVEEHRVGQGVVGLAQPAHQEAGDVPQQPRAVFEHGPQRG